MSAALDGLPCGHLVIDGASRIRTCNAAMTRMAGRPAHELEGSRLDMLFTPGSRLFLQTHVWPMLHADGELSEIQLSLRPHESAELPVMMNASRRALDHDTFEVVIVAMTVRARFEDALLAAKEAAERAERERASTTTELIRLRKHESLSMLAAGVAHDFNNLICVIRGNAELIARSLAARDPARPLLAEVEAATVAAAELTSKMLSYAGAATFALRPLRADDLLNEFRTRRAHPPAALITWGLESGPTSLAGDREQLLRLIDELVANAADAFDGRPPQIQITSHTERLDAGQLASFQARRIRPPGEYVLLTVADAGQGMDAATRDRLFEPFFSTRGMGRGLGLASVVGIVEAHHGGIRVATAPGLGTTVTVALPALGEPGR